MRVATRYQIATGFQSFQSNATRVGCNASSFAFPEFQFQSNATCVGCNSGWLPIIKSILNFNLTQPVWVATANLHKRSNKLSCILCSVCLLFDQTIWSDTTYCNGIISFLYNIWCEATSKTMFTYHSHLWQTKIPSSYNEMAVC